MRLQVRVAIAAAISATVATVPASSAAARTADTGWVFESAEASADVRYYMNKRVKGHPGNWHVLFVSVRQDDDGVTGGLVDLECPDGARPDPVTGFGDCVQVGGADFVDPDYTIGVSWSPRLKYMRVSGDIVLEDYWNGVEVASTIDVRLRASGELTRTVTVTSFDDPDPWQSKHVDRQRDAVSARGHAGWLTFTPTPVTFTRPLQVSATYTRGYGDGV